MTAPRVLNPLSELRPILVVEDNDMDLDFCLQAFASHGIANPVIACRDGEEAVAFIDRHADPADPQFPLLVLLDLNLPKIGGLEVLRHARSIPIWRQVAFVALTTSKQTNDIQGAYHHGVNSYIVKPMDLDAFADVVNQIKQYWIQTNASPFAAQYGN